MAFDKCTLLSSQGSDAPTAQPLSLARRATSLLSVRCRQIGASFDFRRPVVPDLALSNRTPYPSTPSGEDLIVGGGCSLLEGCGALSLSALPFGANNKNITRRPRACQIRWAARACRVSARATPLEIDADEDGLGLQQQAVFGLHALLDVAGELGQFARCRAAPVRQREGVLGR